MIVQVGNRLIKIIFESEELRESKKLKDFKNFSLNSIKNHVTFAGPYCF